MIDNQVQERLERDQQVEQMMLSEIQ